MRLKIFWLTALSMALIAGTLWAVEQGFKPARPADSATPSAKKKLTPSSDVPKDIDSPRERAASEEVEDPKDTGLEKDTERVPEKAPEKNPTSPEKITEKAPEKIAAEEPKSSLPRMSDKDFLEMLDRQLGDLSKDLKQHNQHSDAKSLAEFRQLLQTKEMQNYLRKLSAEEQRAMQNFIGIIANQRSKMAMLAKQLLDQSLGESTPAATPAPVAPAPVYIAEITEVIMAPDIALISAGEDKGLKSGDEVLVYRQGKIVGTGAVKIVRANVAQVEIEPVDANNTVQKGDKITLRK